MSEKTCGVCKNIFHLHEHENGLVFEDNIFVCQNCTTNTSEHGRSEWSDTIMQPQSNGMPIAIWLIHEQNKDKPMFQRNK